MGTSYAGGTPLKTSQNNVWRGRGRTNGFVMKSVDGRIPAVKEGFTRLGIGGSNVLFTDGAVPFGNALFRDVNQIDTAAGYVQTDKPTKGQLAGILEFDQAAQTGTPVLNWGKQQFQRGLLCRSGLVGYKQSMVYGTAQEANYLTLLKTGFGYAQDVNTVRTVYSDWVAARKAGAEGDRLALFFGNISGFPIVKMVVAANIGAPTTGLTAVTFGGWAEILEPENETIYFKIGFGS